MLGLSKSRVAYNRARHTYSLDGRRLSGVTGLILDTLFPGKYDNVPSHIRKCAMNEGLLAHRLMEWADTTYRCTAPGSVILGYRDVCRRLGLWHEASEYVVTDGRAYASPIDKVFSDSDGRYVLAEIKTGDYVDTDYLRWQLSVYRHLFRMQYPNAELGRMLCFHLRKRARYVGGWENAFQLLVIEVEPIPGEVVSRLLRFGELGEPFDCPPPYRPVGREVPVKYLEMEGIYADVSGWASDGECDPIYTEMLDCVRRDMQARGLSVMVTPRMTFRLTDGKVTIEMN